MADNGHLPSEFRYFEDPTHGATLSQADYCPLFSPYDNGDCTNIDYQPVANGYAESYGEGGICVTSALRLHGFEYQSPTSPSCHRSQCVDGVLQLEITLLDDTHHWLNCSTNSPTATIPPALSGTLSGSLM